MNIQNNTILITGASSGIGRATALLCAQRGARLILIARRRDALSELASEIEAASYQRPLCIAADLTRPRDRRHILDVLRRKVDALHVLINNAGITAHGRFDTTQDEVLRKTMELNFFAAAELTQALLPLMKATSGRKGLVFISTPSGLYGIPGRFAYSASKAAAHAWMESTRLELKKYNFFCSIVCPGYTRTALRSSGLRADGGTLQEEQAHSAKSPEYMASKILRAIHKEKRLQLTDANGRFVYYLRTLAPGLLERIMEKKLAADFSE